MGPKYVGLKLGTVGGGGSVIGSSRQSDLSAKLIKYLSRLGHWKKRV